MAYPPEGPALPATPSYSVSFRDPLPPPRRKFQHRVGLHLTLLLLTVATTTLVGALHYHAFLSEFQRVEVPLTWGLLVPGLWYSGSVLAILGAHELGHYAFCRRYDIDASLPYFIPAPVPLTGTLGAVIRIREAFPTRTVLFDIGVAGPIAGFLVLVPALFLGLYLSYTVPAPTEGGVLMLGEPLLFQWAASLMFGNVPDGQTINMHPMVLAAWFGMLATALNLLPFGQLDGGHITYATLRGLSTPISLATVGGTVAMNFLVSTSWAFMALMMVVMLFMLGPRHPRVIDEYEPLGPGRRLVAVAAFGILAICFTPAPIEILDLLG